TFLEARSLNDEGVAFPPTDRVAVPRGLIGTNRQLPPVGVNLPVLVEFLEQENRDAGHLQDLERDPRNRHCIGDTVRHAVRLGAVPAERLHAMFVELDRKSTRLNSSHVAISY